MISIGVVCCLAVTVLTSHGAAADDPTPKTMSTVEGITEYRFANGVQLLLFPDASSSRVTVNMTVLVGSRHEGYGESGMAHLLEHMVFKGTPTHANVPKLLQDHGAQFNGTTSLDRTNYFETLPATDENLEFGIRLEADRLMNSFIKKEDLESEFSVVRNEFESGENSPLSVLGKRIFASAYEWHNYGKSTIGNRSDIERVPIENLQAFYRRYYQPDNVVVIIAGQFREARALELVGKYFGTIPKPDRVLNRTYTEEPAQDGERSVVLRRVGDIGAVGIAYHVPAGPHEDTAALQVLANILSTQPTGRLYRALVETKKATGVFASSRALHDPGLLMIQATVRDAATIDAIRDEIFTVIDGVMTGGVTDEEVNRARQQYLKARELAAADTSQIAISLSEFAAQGDWRLYFIYRDRIERVTASDVQRVAKAYLQRNNRTVGVFIPTEKAERIAIPSAPSVSSLVADYQGRKAVAAGESFEPTPANIETRVQRLTWGEGLKVALLPKKSRGEEVHLSLTLRYGNLENLKGYHAAAEFLAPLMSRGTKTMTYQQLRDELDKLNAVLATSATAVRGRMAGAPSANGVVSVVIQAKRETLPAVLRIMHKVLREPTLPADQFEIMKGERVADIEEDRSEPTILASTTLRRHFAPFPKDDVRYVPTVEESIQRVQATTHEQVLELYRDFLGGQNGELVIVGDFDSAECLPILKETLDGWNAKRPYARIDVPFPPGIKPITETIRTPDKANAVYLSGSVIQMRDDHPDYPALLIANYIYGGGSLASRLGTRVRQREGLSYGVGSAFAAGSFEPRASVTSNAICNPENVGKVTAAIQEELKRLVDSGVTAEELQQAIQGYLQSQKVGRSSDAALVGILSTLTFAERTMEFQANLEQRIAALTAEQVHAAVKKYIRPDQFTVITAGDFK